MNCEQCEWCELIATRRFINKNGGQAYFSCGTDDHDEKVRKLMHLNGHDEWVEVNLSSTGFEID